MSFYTYLSCDERAYFGVVLVPQFVLLWFPLAVNLILHVDILDSWESLNITDDILIVFLELLLSDTVMYLDVAELFGYFGLNLALFLLDDC